MIYFGFINVELIKKFLQSLVPDSQSLFQTINNSFQEVDLSYTILKLSWLKDINFFIKKFIKKSGNNIHLASQIAFFL